MLKLKALSAVDKQTHVELMRDRFATARAEVTGQFDDAGSPYDNDVLVYLANSLDTILGGAPAELKTFVADFKDEFPEFSEYAGRPKKGKDPVDLLHRNTFSVIEKCFDYKDFGEKRGAWNAYLLVELYGLRVCPYCQIHHVNYHIDRSVVRGRRINPDYLIRPPLDHFLPESKYPYLAVSLGNLVPSCAQCNSGVKSADDPLEIGLPHPLDPGTPITVNFSVHGWKPPGFGGKIDEIEIELEPVAGDSTVLVDAFLLRPRYQWYRHEINDMFDRHQKYLEVDLTLRAQVSPDIFVLGFLEDKASERAIGLCMKAIYGDLKAEY